MNMLGVNMTSNLGIGPQIDFVKGKIKTLRYILRTFGQILRSEKIQSTMTKSYIIGTFNHAGSYIQSWDIVDYNALQKSINKTLSNESVRAIAKEIDDGTMKDTKIINLINRSFRFRDEMQNNDYIYFKQLILPQWLIMQRHNLMSIENNHRCIKMTRFTKLLKTGRPVAEFEELMKYLTDNLNSIRRNIRPGANYPYFRRILGNEFAKDVDLLLTTAPAIWIEEFLTLEQQIKFKMMTDPHATNFMKTLYKTRCQHEEDNNYYCSNCGRSNSCYRKSIIKHKITEINDIMDQSHEWYDRRVLIFKNGQWFNTKDENLDDLGPDDIAVINWDKPEERYTTLEKLGLGVNAHLQAVINKLHGLGK